MLPSNLSCVSFADLSSRPSYVPDDNEPDDRFWVFIPSFDVLAVELRQMRVGGDSKGAGQVYDIFIRADDVSLMKKTYPALMRVKDYLNIEVRPRVRREK